LDKKSKINMFFSKESYKQKMSGEIQHYEAVFKNNLFQDVPPIWNEVENIFSDELYKKTGVKSLYQYVEQYALKRNLKKVKILGLGSGACGNELDGIFPLLKKHSIKVELHCVDINVQAMKIAEKEAKKRKINFTPIIQDINKINLPENSYDIIVAYAALHHFLKLDRLAKIINKSLKPKGIFVTVDIPTKNGYLMYSETFQIVNDIWKILPPKYKINHTSFAQPKYQEKYENVDYSKNSFECINSESILPSLNRHLNCIVFVPAFSIMRRFFDTMFGPNYDLRQSQDKSIFEFITELDKYYLDNNILKPETFFGAYTKK
jgi:ubiquinone/menaquinone biosynthesis C-methylase UbiE